MVAAREKPSSQEWMVVSAAREIVDFELVFVGMRLPLLAFLLAQKTHARSAVGLYENGLVRAEATTELLYTMSDPPNVSGATSATSLLDVMGFLHRGRVGLGFVGAAQVDRFGNLDTTEVAAGERRVRLPGSGGASDIASCASRLVVLMNHERHRLVDRVDYLTSPGHGSGGDWRKRTGLPGGGTSAIITDRGVLRFDSDTKEAVLSSYHPLSPESSAAAVVRETGFPLRVSDHCTATPHPAEEELELLRSFDPDGFWLRKKSER
jgi:glutaconate CoA-transferase subunit B